MICRLLSFRCGNVGDPSLIAFWPCKINVDRYRRNYLFVIIFYYIIRPHSFLSTCKDRVVPNMMCLVFKEVNHGNHFPFYPFALLFPGSSQPAAIFISTFFAPDFWFPFILLLMFFSVVRSHMLLSPFSRITSFIFISLRCVSRRLSATMNFLRCHIYFFPSNVFAGTLQLPSQGSADLILDAFTEFWDGPNLCPMTASERQDLARSPPRPLP